MMEEICSELYFGYDSNMTCTFPAVLESMKSADANIELVTSATIRPCRIFYTHNVITEQIAFIICQTHLKGLEEWVGTEKSDEQGFGIGERIPAEKIMEKAKADFINPDLFNIDPKNVHVYCDQTKAQLIGSIHQMKQLTIAATQCGTKKVGMFLLCIGFMITEKDLQENTQTKLENHAEILKRLNAPLDDPVGLHDYHLTYEGEMICYNKLLIELA